MLAEGNMASEDATPQPLPSTSAGMSASTRNVFADTAKATGPTTVMDNALTSKQAKDAAFRSRFLIGPRKSTFIGYWDLITGLALIFTATVTPWEVGFGEAPTTALEAMFLFNRFIDSIFVLDMCLQFRLMYQASRPPPIL